MLCGRSTGRGYPLIDAGMRELWATGWMAQNARMAAAVLLLHELALDSPNPNKGPKPHLLEKRTEGGWRKEILSPMPSIQASFLQRMSYTPLRRRGTQLRGDREREIDRERKKKRERERESERARERESERARERESERARERESERARERESEREREREREREKKKKQREKTKQKQKKEGEKERERERDRDRDRGRG